MPSLAVGANRQRATPRDGNELAVRTTNAEPAGAAKTRFFAVPRSTQNDVIPSVERNLLPFSALDSLLVFLLSAGYLWLFRRSTAMEPDEGIILQGAQRILHGQVLYRDFFTFLTPGSYYLHALLFKIFGSSFLVARTALVFYGGLFSVFTYLMARRVCGRRVSLITASLVTLTSLPWRFLVLHNWDSTLWACAAIYCAMRWMEEGQKAESSRQKAEAESFYHRERIEEHAGSPPITPHSSLLCWAFATGSFASLTILFEQSKGAGLALGLGAAFVILALAGKNQKAGGGRHEAESLYHSERGEGQVCSSLITRHPSPFFHLSMSFGSLAAGFAWPFVVTFAYFGAHGAFEAMLSDWLWPLKHYSRANSVPYGYQNWSSHTRALLLGNHPLGYKLAAVLAVSPGFLIPALPIVAVGVLAYLVLRYKIRLTVAPSVRGLPEQSLGAAPAGLNSGATTQTRDAGGRTAHYILVSAAISGLLISVALSRADILHFIYLSPLLYLVLAWFMEGRGIQGRLVGALRPAIIAWILLSFVALGLAFAVSQLNGQHRITTRRGVVTTPAVDTVLSYTQAHVPGGSKILVYPYLPLYYYLTGTYSATRFEYLQPGMHTLRQDEEAIREMEADRTRVVLFEPDFNEKIAASWPNTPLRYVANDPIGDYILRHYRPCKLLKSASGWPFVFMVRKNLACPR